MVMSPCGQDWGQGPLFSEVPMWTGGLHVTYDWVIASTVLQGLKQPDYLKK